MLTSFVLRCSVNSGTSAEEAKRCNVGKRDGLELERRMDEVKEGDDDDGRVPTPFQPDLEELHFRTLSRRDIVFKGGFGRINAGLPSLLLFFGGGRGRGSMFVFEGWNEFPLARRISRFQKNLIAIVQRNHRVRPSARGEISKRHKVDRIFSIDSRRISQ